MGYAGTSLSQRELADRVHLKPGSLTEALNGLEADGYVQRTRDPFDRRILRVQLTAKGQARAKEIKAEHDQFVAQLFAQITPADKAVLQRILQQHNGRWNTGLRSLQGKLQGINTRLDQMYLDRLNGLLQEQDFARIYEKLCRERQDAEEKIRLLQQTSAQSAGQNWIADFLQQAESDRALLCRLIRRIEIDQQKQVIIFFRFPQPA